MEGFERYLRLVSKTMLVLGMAILAGLMFLTVADISGRAFGRSLSGAYQISELVQVGLICLAWPFATDTGAHVRVDFFLNRLPSRLQHTINIITSAVAVAIFGIISWQGIALVKMTRELGEVVGIIGIPLYPFQIFIPVGAFITSIVLLMQLIKLIRKRENNGGGV